MTDKMEAASLVAEMFGLLGDRDRCISEETAHRLQFQGARDRRNENDIKIRERLTRPLSACARQELVTVLAPVLAADTTLLHILSEIRLMGQRAWMDTLVGLSRGGMLPVIKDTQGVEHVVALVERAEAHDNARRRDRCDWCGRAWVEESWRGRLLLICRACGRETRTAITVPEVTQRTLW